MKIRPVIFALLLLTNIAQAQEYKQEIGQSSPMQAYYQAIAMNFIEDKINIHGLRIVNDWTATTHALFNPKVIEMSEEIVERKRVYSLQIQTTILVDVDTVEEAVLFAKDVAAKSVRRGCLPYILVDWAQEHKCWTSFYTYTKFQNVYRRVSCSEMKHDDPYEDEFKTFLISSYQYCKQKNNSRSKKRIKF